MKVDLSTMPIGSVTPNISYRSIAALFPNPQSIFDGMQVGYVSVRHGNLTFRRRDMVAGTNPLAKFTRV